MDKPARSPKPFPPLSRDIVKFFAVLGILFGLLLLGVAVADLFNLIPN